MDCFDYIIVGAGSAGCVLAARLSENPNNSVLLLEAGGKDSSPIIKMPVGFLKAMITPKYNWPYMSEPEPALNNRKLWIPRGRILGGCSSINGMFYMRGHPQDFEDWKHQGAIGWGYAYVLPYFKKMENSWRGENNYHGTSGPVEVNPITCKHLLHEPLMETAVAAGYNNSDDLSAQVAEGFARGEATIDKKGRRVSAATAYLHPAMKRKNLTVRTSALVHKVIIENGRATGVEYETDGIKKTVKCQRETILCGGTYNSPHLLMLSGVGPAKQLMEQGINVIVDSQGVGKNLQEHANISMEFNATKPVTFLNQLRYDRLFFNALRWQLFGTGPLTTQINSCNVIIKTRADLDRPDMQFMANPIRFDARPWFPGLTKRQSHVFWVGLVALHPKSRGEVTLKSADPRQLPAINFNLLSHPDDMATMRAGVAAARKIYRTEPQGSLIGAERTPGEHIQSDEELDEYIRSIAELAQHPTGTCSMGEGPNAVVDSELRVKGVDGLRVADCSIMPSVPGGNTNAPAMMVGEKLADHILGKVLRPAEIVF